MSILAEWLWNPFLSFLYLEVGVVFLLLTGAVAFRKSFRVFGSIFGTDGPSRDQGHHRQVTHTKAFFAAIAVTVGVGNLAGVGTAIHLGGPGALFWMWMSAIAGMSFRMCSTYLAIKHGPKDPDSPVFATPMAYLDKYMKGSWAWIPAGVAGLIMVKGFISANLIQSNSVAHALHGLFGLPPVVSGAALALLVGAVVIGGLKRIVHYSSAIAPWMVLIYAAAGLLILALHPLKTLAALEMVFLCAFSPASFAGGVAGYTVLQAVQFGVSRGVFSHTSGVGVSPFLQGANTDSPARGAMMSAITPVVDTLIICTITGLVILSDFHWQSITGAHLTAQSFTSGLGGVGETIILLCLVVFAYTTIISFEYFSERCFEYLGGKNIAAFRWTFIGVTFLGPLLPVAFVWSLADVIVGLLVISHLLPLIYVLLSNLSTMRRDLEKEGEPA